MMGNLSSAIAVGIVIALVSIAIYRSTKSSPKAVKSLGMLGIYGLGGSFILFYPLSTVV